MSQSIASPYPLPAVWWAGINRFRRHFPYRCLEVQFSDVRHRAFVEVWHCLPSLSIRRCCAISGLPSASARRLVKRLLRDFRTPHERGELAFGVNIDAAPFSRLIRPR